MVEQVFSSPPVLRDRTRRWNSACSKRKPPTPTEVRLLFFSFPLLFLLEAEERISGRQERRSFSLSPFPPPCVLIEERPAPSMKEKPCPGLPLFPFFPLFSFPRKGPNMRESFLRSVRSALSLFPFFLFPPGLAVTPRSTVPLEERSARSLFPLLFPPSPSAVYGASEANAFRGGQGVGLLGVRSSLPSLFLQWGVDGSKREGSPTPSCSPSLPPPLSNDPRNK